MNAEIFKNISIRGRVVYGTCCLENTIIHYKYNLESWRIVLTKFYSISRAKYIDEWSYSITEIIPDCLLEFDNYYNHDFQYLNEEAFNKLYKLYNKTNSVVSLLIQQIHEIADCHMYSIIKPYGEDSLKHLNEIIGIMELNDIKLPNYKLLKT